MRNIKIQIMIVLLFFIAGHSFAGVITIKNPKSTPAAISTGSKVLINCQVTHSDSLENIKRVASTMKIGNMNGSYPNLYDDGTHGDLTADDGVYSLEIAVGNTTGQAEIVFIAVDTDNVEVESDPVILTIQ